MGNIVRKLRRHGLLDLPFGDEHQDYGGGGLVYQAAPLGPHGVSVETVGFAALARDLFQFDLTGQVPEGLNDHVPSSVVAQTNWYKKLLPAWKTAQPPPNNAAEASALVIDTLHGHRKADVQGLLSFYGLPPTLSTTVAVPPPAVVVPAPAALHSQVAVTSGPWPKGVQYELHSLPVASKDITDGDTLAIHVDTSKDPRESAAVPQPVHNAFKKWESARKRQDLDTGKALKKEISRAGYKVIDGEDGSGEILARKYKVRLRGIDAPESTMPYGPEAKSVFLRLVEGQPLSVLVYTVDRYGRIVADVHCKDGFVQEILLKKGCVWHYATYDHRPEFAKWQQEARDARVGLWKRMYAQEPWEYRKEHKRDLS